MIEMGRKAHFYKWYKILTPYPLLICCKNEFGHSYPGRIQ